MLLLWAVLSLAWSDFKIIGTIRWVQAASVLMGTLVCVTSIGPKRTLEVIGVFLSVVLVLDWISISVTSNAVQTSGDQVGTSLGWRGLHNHKNRAGAVAAIGTLYFLAKLLVRPKWITSGFFGLSVAFLWGTNSRTSIGAAVLASLVVLLMRLGSKSKLLARLLLTGAFFAVVTVIVLVIGGHDLILARLSDPRAFTGRSALWQIGVDYLRDHFWLGSGFGSFWRVGLEGPTLRYSTGWPGFSFHGHNGYLDTFITMGVIGFGLAIVAFVIAPAVAVVRFGKSVAQEYKLIAVAFIFFAIVQNFLETTFLYASSISFVAWAIGLAIIRCDEKYGATVNYPPTSERRST
jgi:O-antigen ligase